MTEKRETHSERLSRLEQRVFDLDEHLRDKIDAVTLHRN